MRVAGDAVPSLAEVDADFVEHLVMGVPADDADIERRLTHFQTHIFLLSMTFSENRCTLFGVML
jgi:hypothetical protein